MGETTPPVPHPRAPGGPASRSAGPPTGDAETRVAGAEGCRGAASVAIHAESANLPVPSSPSDEPPRPGEPPGADPASPSQAFPPALALARLLGATGLGVPAQGPWPEAQAGGWQQSGQGLSHDAAALAPISPASPGLMPGVCPSR
ncbi:translation initiation factor IF-2-like isoform X9 [Aquila chrysaetos chrysaetos]|uniref:translation initiation factor IF-2-like isoform X9 n=1 Tax=Aquila chrysaetos chrysaetos TaxID=223781 RepID=UPI0011772069|nr:translation initiation factor IF-2-like isoform X9 [Aquila chrysaetos chrysaetos]